MCPGNCNGARGVCHRQSTTVVSASGAQHYYLAGQCQCQLGYSGSNCSVIEDASNVLSFSIANAPGMWPFFLLSFCRFFSLLILYSVALIQQCIDSQCVDAAPVYVCTHCLVTTLCLLCAITATLSCTTQPCVSVALCRSDNLTAVIAITDYPTTSALTEFSIRIQTIEAFQSNQSTLR